jgi:putative oxidoreductase
MAKLEPQGWLIDFALLLSRVALGLYLVLAGYSKVFVKGVSAFLEESYWPMVPSWLPSWFATPYGYAVPYGELIVGAALLLGLLGRISALLTFLMITSFTIAQTFAAMNGGKPLLAALGHEDGKPFNPNFIMIALAFLLTVAGSGRFSLDQLLFRRAKSQPAGSAA